MFIGMIISPYNRNNPLPYSQMTCLVISDEISSDGSYRKYWFTHCFNFSFPFGC